MTVNDLLAKVKEGIERETSEYRSLSKMISEYQPDPETIGLSPIPALQNRRRQLLEIINEEEELLRALSAIELYTEIPVWPIGEYRRWAQKVFPSNSRLLEGYIVRYI